MAENTSEVESMLERVVLVTGGARGIGRAVAAEFARLGAGVVIADVRESEGAGVARALSQAGLRATFIRCDVRNEAEIEAAVIAAEAHFGRLDIAVASAGILRVGPLDLLEQEDLEDLLRTNVGGVALLAKHAARVMERNGRRAGAGAKAASRRAAPAPGAGPALPGGDSRCSIIAIGSIAGKVGFPQYASYCASKAAVGGLVRALAIELAPLGIRVNGVAPSLVDTEMVREEYAGRAALQGVDARALLEAELGDQPLRRLIAPEEVARAVVWLSSPAAAMITGTMLPIDGGFLSQ